MTWEGLSPPYATIVADPPWPYEGERPPFVTGKHGGDRSWGRRWDYSSMTIGEIAALPVADLAAPGAHLYLWTTNRFLEDAFRIVRAWGFIPSHTLVWCKAPMGLGTGGRFTITTEFVLSAREPTRAGAFIKAARTAAGLSAKDVCAAIGAHGKINHGGAVSNWEKDLSLPTERDWSRLQAVLPALADIPRPDIALSETAKVDSTWWQWKRGPHSAKPPAFLDLVEQVSPAPRVELFARAQRLGWDSWGWGYEGAAV